MHATPNTFEGLLHVVSLLGQREGGVVLPQAVAAAAVGRGRWVGARVSRP